MSGGDARYSTAEGRWVGIGPYYAMFPARFAAQVVAEYTVPGDVVLDPFAGRGTAIYAAGIQDRVGIGIEINPVGWVYGKAKLRPARKEDVLGRLQSLGAMSQGFSAAAEAMPEFFHHCYARKVRQFLLAARTSLDWRRSSVDRTLAALLLVYLHGKLDSALSNQMRQTKSMAPVYSVRWWREKHLSPPDIDAIAFMESRIEWRYARGRPETFESEVFLGDCTRILPRLQRPMSRRCGPVKLLLTSPPYRGVTNYHYDQWLRLWLLGFSAGAVTPKGKHRRRFNNMTEYVHLLRSSFRLASQMLADDAVVYVRTDRREITHSTTINVLREVFPTKLVKEAPRPYSNPTQTRLFGDPAPKTGEVDIVLEPR